MSEKAGVLETPQVSQKLQDYMLFRNLDLYSKPERLHESIETYVARAAAVKEEQARREGIAFLSDQIARQIVARIINYMELITYVSGWVTNQVQKTFDTSALEIGRILADFDFVTWPVKLMFVVDADQESEFRFCGLLGEIERYTLEEAGYVCELLYINKRDQKIDQDSVECDFPYERRTKP